jgi:hypothetical protein
MIFFYYQYVRVLKIKCYDIFNVYLNKHGYDLEPIIDFTRVNKFDRTKMFTGLICSHHFDRISYMNPLFILETLMSSMDRHFHYYLIPRTLNDVCNNMFKYILYECISDIYLHDYCLIFKLKNNEIFNFSLKFNDMPNPYVKLHIYKNLRELTRLKPINYYYFALEQCKQTIGNILNITHEGTMSLPGIVCEYIAVDIIFCPSLYEILNIKKLFTDKTYDSNTDINFSSLASSVRHLVPEDMTCRGNLFYYYMLYMNNMNELLDRGQLESALKYELNIPKEAEEAEESEESKEAEESKESEEAEEPKEAEES